MIRLGVLGLGAAGQAFLPAIARHAQITLAAVCDARGDLCDAVATAQGVPGFADLDRMLAQGGLDALYVATPTEMHLAHAGAVLRAGLHVLVEKPMAVTSDDARGLARIARETGRCLVVGHSHGHDLPIRRMAQIVASGRLGRVRLIETSCHTDWVYRPRRPEELRPDLGGGVTFRQGAHQFDILCTLARAPVARVSAQTFDWDPDRSTIGAHAATLFFDDGTVGQAVYNGYGHMRSADLTGGIGEWGFEAGPQAPRPKAGSDAEELARKRARAGGAIPPSAPHQPHFGLTVVSCERGTMRQTPDGLSIHTADGTEQIALSQDTSPRDLVLDAFAGAIAGDPAFHDADHGAAIVEICEAVLQSARLGRVIDLTSPGSASAVSPQAGPQSGGQQSDERDRHAQHPRQ